jgi:rRNA processing protein Gar1
MKATLSYPYVGDRYPDLTGKNVVVKEIAELADIPYTLLKNRMGMKKKRAMGLRSVYIEDKDLEPKKRNKRLKDRSPRDQDDVNELATKWLKRPLI